MKKGGDEHLKGTSLAVGKLHNKIVGKEFKGKLYSDHILCILLIN